MSDFVTVPFDVDADSLTATALDSGRAAIPGWEPADGNLEVWLITATAQIVSELTAVAASVPAAIFQRFGASLIGLPQVSAVPAAITVTFTAQDTLGYTVPADTQVGYPISGDTILMFEPASDVVIPAGATNIGGITLTAVTAGAASNGVPIGPLQLVDSLSFIADVSATSVSAGGVDAETDDAYLARLAADLRLLTPRPILPGDFAVLARNVTGVTRAYVLDGYDPGLDELQQVAVTGAPAGGTFTLTYSGQTTGNIAYNAAAGAVQTALVALSNIGAGQVSVTGGPLPATPVVVEFMGTLASTDVAAMTHTDSLTGGSTPAVAVTTTRAGVASSTGNARMVCVFPVDAAGAPCSSVVLAAVQAYLDGQREVTFVVNVAAATSTTINVAFTVHVTAGYDSATVVAACVAAVQAYLSPATWAGGSQSPPVWTGDNKVRYLSVSSVIASVPGVAYVASLSVNSGTSDVTLAGVAPLPAVGTVGGSAV